MSAPEDPDPVVETWHGHQLRASHVERMRVDEEAVRLARQAAQLRPLLDASLGSGIGVNCAKCNHLGDFSDEGMRGHCMHLRLMVATWHNVRCQAFTPRTRPKASDVLKAALEIQEAERKEGKR